MIGNLGPKTHQDAPAFRPFDLHLSEVRSLYYKMVGFLAAPALSEYFLRIGPPQIDVAQRVIVTSAVAFLSVMVCYSTLYKTGLQRLQSFVRVAGIFGALSLIVYLFVLVEGSYANDQQRGERTAIGFILTDTSAQLLTKEAGITPLQLLRGAEWDARAVWKPWSVTVIEGLLFLLWCAATIGVSISFSCFALQQARIAKRRDDAVGTKKNQGLPGQRRD